jgi:type I restriction enzyme R subunit
VSNSEQFRRRDLPHWDIPGATYFVTSCLAGSIPANGLADVTKLQRELDRKPSPPGMSAKDWKIRCWKQIIARIDQWLDHVPVSRHLADDDLAEVIVSTLRHFAGERYELLAYVVMPSHFHWVIRPLPQWRESRVPSRTPREHIMQSVKGFTARKCNQLRAGKGHFGRKSLTTTGYVTRRSWSELCSMSNRIP